MKSKTNNSNFGASYSERANYHHSSSSANDRYCDACTYKVAINECSTFKCKDCGTYIVNNIDGGESNLNCRSVTTATRTTWRRAVRSSQKRTRTRPSATP